MPKKRQNFNISFGHLTITLAILSTVGFVGYVTSNSNTSVEAKMFRKRVDKMMNGIERLENAQLRHPREDLSQNTLSGNNTMPSANKKIDYSKIKWPSENQGGTIGMIHAHQNPMDCSKSRFLVYQLYKKGSVNTRNIGSLYSSIVMWLNWAIQFNRVLILDDRDWNLAECPSNNTECYFKKITNCSLEQHIDNQSDKIQLQSLDDIQKGASDVPQKVVLAGGSVIAWFPLKDISRNSGIGKRVACHFLSAALHYFWRLQPALTKAIQENLAVSIPEGFDPQKTVGMPVRASDKCNGHKLKGSSGGEQDCLTTEQVMELPDKVRRIDPRVDTLLFTSEDPNLVKSIQKYNDVLPAEKKWKIVFNVRDVMQGTGSATMVDKTIQGVSSLQKIIESALTSLHLQMRSRYLLVRYATSWNICMALSFDSDVSTYAFDRHVFSYDEPSLDERWTAFKC